MSPPGLCLVVLGLVSGTPPENLTLDLQGKLETQVGTNLSLGTPVGSVSALLSFTPGVLVEDRSEIGDLKLSYTPLLYFQVPAGPGYPSQVLVLNRVNYEATNQLGRTATISLTGALWFGDQNFSPVVNQGVVPGQPAGVPLPPGALPPVELLKVLYSTTQLGFSLLTSPTLQLALAAGFLYTEGTNDASRLQLPLQRGPFAVARADFLLSKRDTLTPALRVGFLSYGPIFWAPGEGTESGSTVTIPHFQEGLDLTATVLTLKWEHQESAALRTEAAVGGALFNQTSSYDVPVGQTGNLLWIPRSLPVPASTFLLPILSARALYTVSFQEEQPLVFGASAALAPFVNQFAGTVYERVEGTLSADWSPSPFLRLGGSAVVADSFYPEEFDFRMEARAVWSVATSVAVAVGARVAWIDYAVPGALTAYNGFNWSVFISVTGATGALF